MAYGYKREHSPTSCVARNFDGRMVWTSWPSGRKHARPGTCCSFALRLGERPRDTGLQTTPRPIELIKAIIANDEGQCVVTRGSTFDNAANLSASALDKLRNRYAGTRLGRQELNAELLGDMPGAIWPQSVIDTYRAREEDVPELERTVVALDVATTSNEESNETRV